MTKGPELGNVPIEDDPTGMRALLSSLPDPDPMPADLEERILASLAAQAHEPRSVWAPDPTPPVPTIPRPEQTPGAHLHEIAPRRRRSALPWLVAAGVVGVLALGGGSLIRSLSDSDTSASSGASSSLASDATGDRSTAGAQESAPPRESRTTGIPPATEARELLRDSGQQVTAGSLRQAARELRDATVSSFSAGEGVRDFQPAQCAGALGFPDAAEVRADRISFEGTPAYLLLTQAATGGAWSASVVGPECGRDASFTPLAGPLTLP